jgi:hypothetical protein
MPVEQLVRALCDTKQVREACCVSLGGILSLCVLTQEVQSEGHTAVVCVWGGGAGGRE